MSVCEARGIKEVPFIPLVSMHVPLHEVSAAALIGLALQL